VRSPGNPRSLFRGAALVYAAFVIYGSLMPFDLRRRNSDVSRT